MRNNWEEIGDRGLSIRKYWNGGVDIAGNCVSIKDNKYTFAAKSECIPLAKALCEGQGFAVIDDSELVRLRKLEELVQAGVELALDPLTALGVNPKKNAMLTAARLEIEKAKAAIAAAEHNLKGKDDDK